jgi:hypothetical protein
MKADRSSNAQAFLHRTEDERLFSARSGWIGAGPWLSCRSLSAPGGEREPTLWTGVRPMTPALIAPVRERPKCPVCGKVSYSSAGIHPQCAVNRADAKLRLILKAKREAEAAAAPPGGFSKRCSGCGRAVAAPRLVCACGRALASGTLPRPSDIHPLRFLLQEIPIEPSTSSLPEASNRGISSPP